MISFGTDSQLDKDIKERLMQQVFSVLPVLSDDHAAYLAFHKAESEKRLNAQRAAAAKQPVPPEKKPTAPRRRDPPKVMQDHNVESNEVKSDGQSSTSGETTKDESKVEPGQEEGGEDEEEEEECSPERLEEIKKILADVYEKFSPEKINKIDRLLNKYLGHEEEFLNFVFSKYGVSPSLYPSTVKKSKKDESNANRDGGSEGEGNEEDSPTMENQNEHGQESDAGETDGSSITNNGDTHSALPPKSSSSKYPNNNNNNNNNSNQNKDGKRYSRSLSPPRTQANSNKRPVAAWKMCQPDEEAAFKTEVFSIHIPEESEEWLKFEMSKLDQCTRIFPIERKKKEESGNKEEGGEENKEDNEEDKEENEDEEDDGKAKKDDKPKAKSATYEDIMFQVSTSYFPLFLHHCIYF